MKIKNLKLQNIRLFHEIIKQKLYTIEMLNFSKLSSFMLSKYLLSIFFGQNYCISEAWYRGDPPITQMTCYGTLKLLICITGSGDSHLPLGNTRYILCGVQVRLDGCDVMVRKPVISSFDIVGRCQVLLEKEINIPPKGVDRSLKRTKIC